MKRWIITLSCFVTVCLLFVLCINLEASALSAVFMPKTAQTETTETMPAPSPKSHEHKYTILANTTSCTESGYIEYLCDCGSSYIGCTTTTTYMCKAKYTGKNCNNTKGISINLMDSILWWCAKQEYASLLSCKSTETKQQLEQEKEVWVQKLNTLESLYNKIQEKLDRQAELYGDLAISKEVYQQRKSKILEEKKELDNNAVNYQNEIERINGILESEYNSETSNLIDSYILPMVMKQEELLAELDNLSEKRKYEVVHQFVKEVRINTIDQYQKVVTVIMINYIGLERELTFNAYPNRHDKSKCVEFINGDELEGFNFYLRFRKKAPKDIEQYRIKHNEYARNSRRNKKEKGAN